MAKKIEKIIVRSVIDLGDYNDDEIKPSKEPSLTDPSQDEPIERLVVRLLRGESVASIIPAYDSQDGSVKPEDLMSQQSIAEREGFDLADVPPVIKAGERAAKALKKVKKPEVIPPAEKQEKPKEEAPKAPPVEPK